MIDNAYTLREIADFMGLEDEKSLKKMGQKETFPFPLTPITLGQRRIYCVYQIHWEDAIEHLAQQAIEEFKKDQCNLRGI